MNLLKKTGKKLEGLIREARLAPRVFLKYGTFSPDKVEMPNAISPIHIKPGDRRAKKKILFDSIRGRYSINRRFWVDFVTSMAPDVALDIGVNYGECIFSPTYPPNVTAIGFEANPELFDYLNKSLAEHPSAQNIELVNALVDEKPGGQVDFFVDTDWSGGSTAIASIAEGAVSTRKLRVETQSVDAVLRGKAKSPDSVVFKIDVEGFEPQVLLGMRETLGHASQAVGFIEVDTRFLEKTCWPPLRYDNEILYQFDLYAQTDRKSLVFRKIESLAAYCQSGDRKKHFDLLVFKKGVQPEVIPQGWLLQG